jgi:hypothetical protein
MDVSLKIRLLQIFSFAVGLAFMYAVGILEGMEEHHGETHHIHDLAGETHHDHHSHGEL